MYGYCSGPELLNILKADKARRNAGKPAPAKVGRPRNVSASPFQRLMAALDSMSEEERAAYGRSLAAKLGVK